MTPKEKRKLMNEIHKLSQKLDNHNRGGDYIVGKAILNHKYWPYQCFLEWTKVKEAERFCYDSFKSRNWRNHGTFFGFKKREEWVWFKLKFQ